MRQCKSEYCQSCYYKQNADAAIELSISVSEYESNKIKPCDLCDGELLWVWQDVEPDYFDDEDFG